MTLPSHQNLHLTEKNESRVLFLLITFDWWKRAEEQKETKMLQTGIRKISLVFEEGKLLEMW